MSLKKKQSIFDNIPSHTDHAQHMSFPSKLMDSINEERNHINKTIVDGELIKEEREIFYIPKHFL